MSSEKLFGGPARAAGGNSDHDGLKLVLHRYIIDAIEESGKNLLEGTRQSLAQFVVDKVSEYITRMRLAISRYEMERLAEEIVDELTGFGPLEVLLRDPYCRGVVLLGLNATAEFLADGFQQASQSTTCRGFAVGRTIFQEPSRAWLAGEIDDETLIQRVQATFEQLINAWRSARV